MLVPTFTISGEPTTTLADTPRNATGTIPRVANSSDTTDTTGERGRNTANGTPADEVAAGDAPTGGTPAGEAAAFVRAWARLAPTAHVSEIQLHQADEPIGLWELTEGEFRSEQPPPFWAFAWAGGQALARYLLDHPETVAGRRVLDLATGSGLVAIAAARCGAAGVRAVDIDPVAVAAVGLNATANGVSVDAECADLLDGEPNSAGAGRTAGLGRAAGAGRTAGLGGAVGLGGAGEVGRAEVVLAGDAFYSQAMADRMLRFLLRAARGGARVLVGDPDRAFLPRGRFRELASYDVPVPPALESVRIKLTRVWELNPPANGGTGTGTGTG